MAYASPPSFLSPDGQGCIPLWPGIAWCTPLLSGNVSNKNHLSRHWLLVLSLSHLHKLKTLGTTETLGAMVGMNVRVHPKFTGWNPNTQSDGVRSGGLWEVMRS